jgi:SAM-dependent methyltransferase
MLLDGELTVMPITTSHQQILDIGTGTGIWPIEMGEKYDFANITGIDESPIQPTWVPPNVHFQIDDVTKPWLQAPNSIDFVHIRTMAGCIRDWQALLSEAFQVLRPGGLIEVTDIVMKFDCSDGTYRDDSAAKRWVDEFHEIGQKEFHIDFSPSPKMEGWLKEVGFEIVHQSKGIVPIGGWPKDAKLKMIGRYFLSQMLEGGMENYSIALFTKAGWDPTEVHALLGEVRKEIKDPKTHLFTRA